MRGLLDKDLRLAIRRKNVLVIFLIVTVIMGFSVGGVFTVGYLALLATIIAVSTVSYDEADNGMEFLMTLPFSRKTYVREKYLLSLILGAGAILIGTVIVYGIGLVGIGASSEPVSLVQLLPILPGVFMTAIIIIPLQLKFGMEKSRIALAILIGGVFVLTYFLRGILGSDADTIPASVVVFAVNNPSIVLLIAIACEAVLFFISYFISVRIVEKKEY